MAQRPPVTIITPTPKIPIPIIPRPEGFIMNNRIPVIRGDYYPQDQPRPDEFVFMASPENSEFIQASIETGRAIYPSLETYIQVAEEANILPTERNREQYPSYMRNASP